MVRQNKNMCVWGNIFEKVGKVGRDYYSNFSV